MVPGVGLAGGTSTAAGGGAARWAAAGLAGGTSTAAGGGASPPTLRSLLLANATHAWLGDDLPASGGIAAWPAVVGGADATQATSGSRPTVGALNSQRAALFDGADDWLATGALATIAQPAVVISVSRRTGSLGPLQIIHDGISSSNRMSAGHNVNDGALYLLAGSQQVSAVVDDQPLVLAATYDGASSSLRRNGVAILSGVDAGGHTVTGVTIGAAFLGVAGFFTGEIALVVVVAGANYVARAAVIEAAARASYGIAP